MRAQLIPTRVWAKEVFGDHAPHPNTLLNWINGGKISPRPVKIGSRYFCSPDARYVDPFTEKVLRMVNGR